MPTYSAGKAFVLHFSEALWAECREHGVTVMALCPGTTETEFFDVAGVTGWLKKHKAHSADYVVRKALKSFEKGKQCCVPGFTNKLILLSVTFIVAIIVAIYSLLAEKQIAIEFARKELAGVAYLERMRGVYAALLALPSPEGAAQKNVSLEDAIDALSLAEAGSNAPTASKKAVQSTGLETNQLANKQGVAKQRSREFERVISARRKQPSLVVLQDRKPRAPSWHDPDRKVLRALRISGDI